jgi:hypothetical protein
MTTIISHVYNEEALLPLWLKHHSKYFENGIIIDFNSTDKTKDIISMYPSFKLYQSTLNSFDAEELDKMVATFESEVSGIRIILNVTEFLLGNPSSVDRDYFIPSISLINMENDKRFNWSKQFFEQRNFGISYENNFSWRRSRILTNRLLKHPLGRHYETIDNGDFLIVHVANCLVDESMIKRRLQIQNKMPEKDKIAGRGFQHVITRDQLFAQQEDWRSAATDISSYIKKYNK